MKLNLPKSITLLGVAMSATVLVACDKETAEEATNVAAEVVVTVEEIQSKAEALDAKVAELKAAKSPAPAPEAEAEAEAEAEVVETETETSVETSVEVQQAVEAVDQKVQELKDAVQLPVVEAPTVPALPMPEVVETVEEAK